MKKIFTTAAMLMAATLTFSQFSDDFESYTAGSYLAQSSNVWTTWSNMPGSSEDVVVVNDNAHSGSNSVYLSSVNQNGGPTDLVLPIANAPLTDGIWEYSMWVNVQSGKGGYFNIQGDAVIGTTWAADIYFNSDGTVSIQNGGTNVVTGNFPIATWFEFKIVANLTLNAWELFIDGVSQGVWSNGYNQVASLDFYPLNGDGFWIDDVYYNHTPYTMPNFNAMVLNISNTGKVVGQTKNPSVMVKNAGQTTITSFDVTLEYNGNQITESISNISLASLSDYTVNFSQSVTLVSGQNTFTAYISNVNGNTSDDDPSDDTTSVNIPLVEAAEGKVVVAEEGTGTWCGWCPRGLVSMEYMEHEYGNMFEGIAVHNGDPMVDSDYDSDIGAYFSGYPSAMVDRGNVIDPSEIETDFLNNITVSPAGVITMGAQYNSSNNTLDVSMSVKILESFSGNWKVACVLTEDSVTGTSSGYDQANYYSSQSQNQDLIDINGVNWKNLPNPVPASQMVYNEVAREIQPSFAGMDSAFGSGTVAVFDVHVFNFTFQLSSTWNINNLSLVGLLIEPSGKINNAGSATYSEAVTNGYTSEGVYTATVHQVQNEAIKLFPNPTSFKSTNVQMTLSGSENISIEVFDMLGKQVMSRNYGTIARGMYNFPINFRGFENGMYLVKVKKGKESKIFKVNVQ
ncbi:MAG: T9SS C-terminal target domain-containing protein [Bacteroidetes bacterium]|nr:MAG: T9SS C-terminal target domain-containing protein [Bacteroidota bacterium]